jgi:hypothetical protein
MHIDFVILINSFSQSLDAEKILTLVKMVIIKSLTFSFRLKSVCVFFVTKDVSKK